MKRFQLVSCALVWALLWLPATTRAMTADGQGEVEAYSYQTACPQALSPASVRDLAYKVKIYGTFGMPGFNENPPLTLERFIGGKTGGEEASIQAVAFGELATPGRRDAVVAINANTSGNAIEYYITALTRQGGVCTAHQAYLSYPPIQVERLRIRDRRIIVSVRYSGPGEPNCCPKQRGRLEFRLGPNGLELVKGIRFPRWR